MNLYFRGYNNTRTILADIPNLSSATHFVLTGGSAGGVAAYYWADQIKSMFSDSVKYAVIPDSGYIYDTEDVKTKTHLIRI